MEPSLLVVPDDKVLLRPLGTENTLPIVSVIMGSESDWKNMRAAVETLLMFGIPCEYGVVSAHRTAEYMVKWAQAAEDRGIKYIIAGAGGAAHLPGMIAALSGLPVIGVPIRQEKSASPEMASLLSILQMPPGAPVGTMAVNGAKNAALYAVTNLSMFDPALRVLVKQDRIDMAVKVLTEDIPVDQRI